ncbi:MAG: glycosyltransferase family 9 protein [Candidatus Brocadiia bacterium]
MLAPKKIKSILVLRLGGIGDVVMATPVFRALKAHFSNARITLLSEEPGAEVVRGAPYVDELLPFRELYTYRRKSLMALPMNIKSFIEELRLAKTLLQRRYDIFVDLHMLYGFKNAIRPMMIGCFSRAPIRVGLDTDRHSLLMNIRVPDSAFRMRHLVDRSLDVIGALGVDTSNRQTEVWITEADRKFARELLDKNIDLNDKLLIGIHAGANPWALVRQSWPLERFAAVADILSEKYGAKIVFTGGRSEISLIEQATLLMKKKPFIAAGLTTLKQAAALMERCHLFISNDTGPMHMAVAMKTPTIGIFGPGNWPALGTYAPETNFIMVRKDIDCWPCHNLKCATRACMERIAVDDVVSAAGKQISKLYANKFGK